MVTVKPSCVALGVLPLVLFWATACGGGSRANVRAAAAITPPAGRPQAPPRLRQPPQLRSRHGLLRATLIERPASFHIAGRVVRGNGYDGRFVGPTLRVRPGDTIELHLVNRLGRPTNLHAHGLHVSPTGDADNVLRVMAAGSTDVVRIRVPRTAAYGTYWYHPHMHGDSEAQVFSGLSGAIVVDGLRDRLPARLRRIPDRLIALKDFQASKGAIKTEDIDSGQPTTRTVDGMVDPELSARPGQTQLWRLANIGADIWYRLYVPGLRFHVLAEDGNPVARVWAAGVLNLPPGKRYDVLVRFGRTQRTALETLAMSTGPGGDHYPRTRLASVRVAGRAVRPVPVPGRLAGVAPRLLPRFAGAHVDHRRVMTFSENEQQRKFMINGRVFDPHHVNAHVRLGDTEEWVLRNVSKELHPFHMHTNAFQVMSIDGRPYHARSLQDTVSLPVGGRVVIRVRFATFTGRSMFHCHILNHEDHGMMGMIDVTKTGVP